MPQTRQGVFPVLLPLIVIVPVAAALAVLGTAAWHARESRGAALQAARGELTQAARGIEQAARARQQAAALLALSPALRAWAAGADGQAEQARADMAAVAALFDRPPSASASRAADGAVLREGPPAPADGSGAARAGAPVRDGERDTGEVVLEAAAAALAAEAGLAGPGSAIVAVTDGVGTILHLSGAAVAGARTISDIFPRIERKIFISAREGTAAPGGLRVFDDRVGTVPVVIAVSRPSVADWRLFVAVPAEGAAPLTLLAGLALFAAVALAGLLAWTGRAAARMRRGHAEEMEHEQWKLREARSGLEECAHLAREAAEAVAAAADASRRAASHTDGAAAAVGEARPLVAETGAMLGERSALLGRAFAAAEESAVLAESTAAAAAGAGAAAARTEEELAKAIAAAGSASRSAARIKSRVSAIGTLAERARLLSLNASVEAGRGDDGARRLLRAVEEIQGLAGRAAESARGLAAECAAAAEDAQSAQSGAEEAGRSVGTARASAGQAVEAAARLGERVAGLRADGAGPAGPAGASGQASAADRAGSALAGIERICARITEALRESGAAAAQAAQKCGEIVRAGHPGPDEA